MRVLLIEDESRLAENVTAALVEGPGYAVDSALDGRIGLLLAENRCYDLIILDLMLPMLDGPTLLAKLRAGRDPTPVLVLTARGGSESIISLLNLGPTITLQSPSISAN
jgi:two-component system response regulator PhoP